MLAISLILALVLLDILAVRFGYDSRDGFGPIDASGLQPWPALHPGTERRPRLTESAETETETETR